MGVLEDRANQRLARELHGIKRMASSHARSRQIAFSDVPIETSEGEVSIPVTDLLQNGVEVAVEVGQVGDQVTQIIEVDVPLAQKTAQEAKDDATAAQSAAAAAEQHITEVVEFDITPLRDDWEAFTLGVATPLTMAGIKADLQSASQAAFDANFAAGNAQTAADNAQTAASDAASAAATAASAAGDANTAAIAAQKTADLGYWQARAVNAKSLLPDTTFREGVNGLNAYRAGNLAVPLQRIASSADTPTQSGFMIRTSDPGQTGSKNYSGFQTPTTARPGAIFLQRFIAKIPVGTKFLGASNSVGSAPGAEGMTPNGNGVWLTPQDGTGKYQQYVRLIVCGTTGSFGTTGHVYIEGPTSTGSGGTPIVMDLAQAEILDLTDAPVQVDLHISDSAPPVALRKSTTLWIDTTPVGTPAVPGNTPKRWNGTAWVAATDKAALDAAAAAVKAQQDADKAITDAYNAQQKADKAAADVLLAQSKADSAFGLASTADGRVTIASSNPTANDALGKPLGAIWEVRDPVTKITVRRYVTIGVLPTLTWEQTKVGADFIGDKAIGRAQIGDAAIGTLQVGDGMITNAKIGDLHGGKIDAGTVTAREAAFGLPENLIPNGVGEAGAATHWANGLTFERAGSPIETAGWFKCNPGQGSYGPPAYWFDVEPGQDHIMEIWLKADKPGSKIYVSLTDEQNSHGTRAWGIEGEENPGVAVPGSASGTAYPVNSLDVPTTLTRYAVRVVPDADAPKLRVGTIFFNHSAGSDRTAQVWIAMRMRRMVGGTYISPNGIKTPAIDVGAIVARHIAADVGQELDISGNGAVNIVVSSIEDLEERAASAEGRLSSAEGVANDMAGRVGNTEKAITDHGKQITDVGKSVTALATDVGQQKKYFRFTDDGLIIGISGGDVGSQVVVDNDIISMNEGGVPRAWLQNATLFAESARLTKVVLGKHSFEAKPDGTGTTVRAI